MRFQKQLFLGLTEEMKNKIILSLQNTNRIINESTKEYIQHSKRVENRMTKEIHEIEGYLNERDKMIKR